MIQFLPFTYYQSTETHVNLIYTALHTTADTPANNANAKTPTSMSWGRRTPKSNTTMNDTLKESVFLVMGRAVPEGDSVYVMIRDSKRNAYGTGPENFLIINPWTGYMYSAVDPNCPLRDVYLLATPSNVWANIQVNMCMCVCVCVCVCSLLLCSLYFA